MQQVPPQPTPDEVPGPSPAPDPVTDPPQTPPPVEDPDGVTPVADPKIAEAKASATVS